jgi:TRAP-type mannitol/chloroaromatic compound transport system permease small subunit
MPRAIRLYVKYVEAVNRVVGRVAMYMIFVMIGVLLYSAISRSVFNVPLIWVVEVAQMLLAAYYLLGGAYSVQLESHVRMDLAYGHLAPRRQAFTDTITAVCLISYLILLLVGGISSTQYALEYGQKNYSTWAPPLAPIKIVMCIGITLMLLQAIAIFFKDLARVRGQEIA